MHKIGVTSVRLQLYFHDKIYTIYHSSLLNNNQLRLKEYKFRSAKTMHDGSNLYERNLLKREQFSSYHIYKLCKLLFVSCLCHTGLRLLLCGYLIGSP